RTGRRAEDVLVNPRRVLRPAGTGVREGDVVLAGHSLGTGVSVDLAASDGARGPILEGAYTSLPAAAASLIPLLPGRPVMQTRLPAADKIPAYGGPLLQVHGAADGIAPHSQGLRVFAAAGGPKQFVTVRGGDHHRLYTPSTWRPSIDSLVRCRFPQR